MQLGEVVTPAVYVFAGGIDLCTSQLNRGIDSPDQLSSYVGEVSRLTEK